MIKHIYKELLILLVLFIIIWVVFSFLKINKVKIDVDLPIETEESIGDLLINSYLNSNVLVNDSVVVNAIDIISARLLNSIDSTSFYYRFYVIENSEVNAFAFIGGNIIIYTGLLKNADSPEEVAAVLAHEIGHIEKRHVSDMLIQKIGLAVLLSILTGGDSSLLIEIIELSASNKFSRLHEEEADDFGLDLLEKSKISPNNMAKFFKKVKKQSTLNYEEKIEILSTHPDTDKRIRKSLRYKTKNDFESLPFDMKWDELKRRLI